MKSYITALMLLSINPFISFAQKGYKITGEVVNSNGEALSLVTIQAARSNTWSGSDNNGNFSITILYPDDTLIFSHVNYIVQKIPVSASAKSPLKIMLDKNSGQLDEVVINTGYQTISKERATGSTYTLSNQLLSQMVSTNILDKMDYITSGMQVDKRNPLDAPKYMIRGLSTITGAIQSPLIILDNFPYEGDLNNINPNDVENITVLKDAAATSIWGARAGNGVIVITTKKTKANEGIRVSITHNTSVAAKPDLMSASQIPVKDFIDVQKFLFDKGFYDWRLNSPNGIPVPEVAEILYRQKNDVITSQEAERQLDSLANNDIRKDMQRYLYRPELRQQSAVSFSGSGGNLRYLLSSGFDRNFAALKGNDLTRYTLRSENNLRLNRSWDINFGMLFTASKTNQNSPGGYGSYYGNYESISPYSRMVDADGNPAAIDIYNRGTFTDTAGNGKLLDWKFRPLQQLQVNDYSQAVNDLLLKLGNTISILPWISADVLYQYQQSLSETRNYETMDNYFLRNDINMFTTTSGDKVNYGLPAGSTLYTIENRKITHSGRLQFNINKKLGQKGSLQAIAGTEIRSATTKGRSGTVYGIDDNTQTTQAVDFVSFLPTYNDIWGTRQIPDGNNLTQYISRFVSLYGNASYTYDHRYTFYTSFRRDASNIFGVSSNNKWQPLWSAGGLWKIDKEQFFKSSLFNSLQLRSSYGISGNVDPSTSALLSIKYLSATNSPYNIPSVDITAPQNKDLRWEKVKTLNLGIDAAILNNRLTLTADVYKKRSEDLIYTVYLDPTLGYISHRMNAASMRGKGIDLIINSRNLDGRFSWNTTALLSYADYYVDELSTQVSSSGQIASGNLFPIKGYNPYAIIVYPFAGLDPQTGDPMGYVNGVVSKDYSAIQQTPADQRDIYKTAVAPWYGSLRNTLLYRHFSLAFNISYKWGHYFLRPALNYTDLFNQGIATAEYLQRWQQPGDELMTNTPSMVSPASASRDQFYQNSSVNVEKAGLAKLQDVFLSYDYVPATRRLFQSAQVFCYVNQLNILIWKANKAGLDPDLLYNSKPMPVCSFGIKLNY